MPNINITVAEKIATNTTPGEVIVCGNSDYTVNFTFDAEWTATALKIARFVYVQGGAVKHQEVEFTGNTVAVPILYDIQEVQVGVYAGDLQTTTPARILCDRSILCGDGMPDVLPPSPKELLQAQVDALTTDTAAMAGYDVTPALTWIDGIYIDKTSGAEVEYQTWKATDFIPVNPGMVVVSSQASSFNAFYDGNKKYLSGADINAGTTTGVYRPAGACYVRFSVRSAETLAVIIPPRATMRELSEKKLRVATMNFGAWRDGQNAYVPNDQLHQTAAKWRRMVGAADADLVCGQEYYKYFDVNQTELANPYIFGFKYPYMYADAGASGKNIVSKYYMDNVEAVPFNNDSSRTFLKTYIWVDGKKVCVLNAHADIQQDFTLKRRAQFEQLKAVMDSEEYCICMGDLNVFSSEELDTFAPYKRANCGDFGAFETWHNFGEEHDTWKNKAIDNIIFTSNLSLQNVRLSEWNDLSDHVMLVADFIVNAE